MVLTPRQLGWDEQRAQVPDIAGAFLAGKQAKTALTQSEIDMETARQALLFAKQVQPLKMQEIQASIAGEQARTGLTKKTTERIGMLTPLEALRIGAETSGIRADTAYKGMLTQRIEKELPYIERQAAIGLEESAVRISESQANIALLQHRLQQAKDRNSPENLKIQKELEEQTWNLNSMQMNAAATILQGGTTKEDLKMGIRLFMDMKGSSALADIADAEVTALPDDATPEQVEAVKNKLFGGIYQQRLLNMARYFRGTGNPLTESAINDVQKWIRNSGMMNGWGEYLGPEGGPVGSKEFVLDPYIDQLALNKWKIESGHEPSRDITGQDAMFMANLRTQPGYGMLGINSMIPNEQDYLLLSRYQEEMEAQGTEPAKREAAYVDGLLDRIQNAAPKEKREQFDNALAIYEKQQADATREIYRQSPLGEPPPTILKPRLPKEGEIE